MAVKVLEHALEAPVVQQVRLQAALSMSISHPNVCATFKVCTCTVEPPLCAPLDEGSGGGSGEGSSGGAGEAAPLPSVCDGHEALGATLIIQEVRVCASACVRVCGCVTAAASTPALPPRPAVIAVLRPGQPG